MAVAAKIASTMRTLQRHAAVKLGVDLLAMRTVQVQRVVASLSGKLVGLELDAVFLKENRPHLGIFFFSFTDTLNTSGFLLL